MFLGTPNCINRDGTHNRSFHDTSVINAVLKEEKQWLETWQGARTVLLHCRSSTLDRFNQGLWPFHAEDGNVCKLRSSF